MTNGKKNIQDSFRSHKLKHVGYFTILVALLEIIGSNAGATPSFRGGLSGGYSMLSTSSQDSTLSVHGGNFGFHLQFHFNETWAIQGEGAWHKFGDYQFPQLNSGAVLPPVTKLSLFSGSIGVLYKLDKMRITPYLYAGIAPLYYKHTNLDTPESFLDLALRLDFGIDVRTVDWLELGVFLRVDTPFMTNSPYDSNLGIWMRVSVLWEWQEFGEGDEAR